MNADGLTRAQREAQSVWGWIGRERPPFTETASIGQESMWDDPGGPALDAEPREVVVGVGGVEIVPRRQLMVAISKRLRSYC